MTPQKCTAQTSAGRRCRAWAVQGSSPPRCARHGGGSRAAGAPTGNSKRPSPGFYATDPETVTIDQAIAGLVDKMRRIDALMATAHTDHLLTLLTLYTQSYSRLGACCATGAPYPARRPTA
jgi:hypothetical protein